MRQQILDSQVVSIQELKRYQSLDADSSLIDTVVSLAKEEPQFPPLYFVLVRFWGQWFGNSVAVTRSVSALISLLAFPCIYWLCLELFKSPLTGWIAMALIAISPFHVLYAQEARPYSLWTVTILLSSAALLRAIRLQTKLSWVTYALTLVFGLYTYLYFALVVIGHAVYAIATEGFRWSKTTLSYGLALLAGVFAFGFWPLAVIINRPSLHNVSGFWYNSATRQHLLNRWATSFTRVFIDFGSGFSDSFRELLPLVPLILSGLILVGYAIFFLCHHTVQRVWLFVLVLIGSQVVFLMLPDLILGRWRLSGETRYLIPCYLGIQLAIAYLLSTKMGSIYTKLWQQKFWQLATGLVLLAGIVSCTRSSQAEVWWNKGYSQDDPDVAKIVNNAKQPLVIADDSLNALISLSYLLNQNVSFQLVAPPNIPKIPEKFSEVFLYRASDALRSSIQKEHNYKVEPAQKKPKIVLWKLTKQ